jgi:hypothetical protein
MVSNQGGLMKKSTQEILTGLAIGLIISILFFAKLAFGAELSESDVEMLENVTYLEAGNQDLVGKRLVVSVILNRVDSEEFPDTVSEVLSQENQFTTYRHLNNASPTWQDKLAVQLEQERRLNTEVYFFRTNHYGCGDPLFQYGDHYFSTIK